LSWGINSFASGVEMMVIIFPGAMFTTPTLGSGQAALICPQNKFMLGERSVTVSITEKTDSSKAIYYAGSFHGDIKRFDPATLTHSDFFMKKPSGGGDQAYCLVASND